ncbi:MAG: tetratricopeptide repeat protein, partial [Bradyrhizobiaceae bacterium]|nr:tetratricopeptide repeat protein [Bradyrhizobiaceae bacterium]
MSKSASPQFIATLGRTIEEGATLQRQGRLAEAEKIYTRILKIVPDQFETLQLLAELKMQRAKPGEALRLMTAAVAAQPDSADARIHLGHVLRALKRDADALVSYERALAIQPRNIEALGNRGDILLTLRRPAEALACFDTVLGMSPHHTAARANRGVALAALNRREEALIDFETVVASTPNPMTLFNYGTTLAALNRHAQALTAFDHVLSIDSNHVGAWNGRGASLNALNRHGEAIASFDRALVIDPDHADAHFNKALSLLAIGEYRQGLAEYEWRWKRSGAPAPHNFARPLWRGEYPLLHRTILLHAEQGLGDTIQFLRYANLLVRSGTKVILEVHGPLKPLLSRLKGYKSVIALGETRPAYDVHCPLGTLPLAFKTEMATTPADIPYVFADAGRVSLWRGRLEPLGARRVALVWAGNADHPNDHNRSIPLANVRALWSGAAARFVSLQRDLRTGDDVILAASPVLHLGDELADFEDTAAVLDLCDLVITVDTSV